MSILKLDKNPKMICASKSTEKSLESNHLKALCVKECQHQKSITIQKSVSDDDDNDGDGDDNDDDNDDGDGKDGDGDDNDDDNDDVDDDSAETERQVSFLWQPNHIRPPLYPTISNPDLHN